MGGKIFYGSSLLCAGLVYFSQVGWAGEADPGRALYLKYCSSCHGGDGKGKGAVTPYLKLKIPDLTILKKNNKGIFPYSSVMSSIDGTRTVRGHGDSSMPVWGEVFKEELKKGKYQELTALLKAKLIADYVATLQR